MEIIFDRVTKQYKKSNCPALRDFSLAIPSTGVFGLLGPNGAGKTTMMRLVAALLRPTSGRVSVGAYDTIQHPAKVRQLLGYVPQEYSVYPNLSAREFLDYMALLSEVDKRQERINQVLEIVGLRAVADRRLKTFSGGMKQRVVLAQAILHNPPILLVDEPTTGLDPEERARFREWLLNYANRRAVVFSTHIVDDLTFICDELAVLGQGQLVFHGKTRELIRQAEHKIWRTRILRQNLGALSSQGKVISARLLEDQPDWAELRFIREGDFDTPEGVDPGEPVQPTLEDAYLYLQKKIEGPQ